MKMTKAAMGNLGGQATSKELIAEILRMPESSSLSSAMATNNRKKKSMRKLKPVILWQATVSDKMGTWFETTDPSGRRGAAYRLRPATT